MRFAGYTDAQFRQAGVRIVPPAVARTGSFIGKNVIMMPSYVNIGAYVDEGTMVDTWATVGSCAQVGKNVHLSGGVGLGGVLEPLQANPTIIEDGCFIGARSEVVEGVIVEANSVLAMGDVHQCEHEDLRSCDRRDPLRPGAGGFGRRTRQPALLRRQVLAVLCGDRQARGRTDASQDVHQRAAAHVSDIQRDTLQLAKALIACRSVTPADDGALALVASRLSAAGFRCERLDRGSVGNLWACHGDSGPLVCLAGHVDVVPPGPVGEWTSDPFTPTERGGALYGRGAADMKGSVAAMVTAAERVAQSTAAHGTVAILLTSDEEGDAVDGTAAVVSSLRERGDTIDACIVGEPTSTERFGDTIKNGRRGSLNGRLRVRGQQCHIAYPERGRNPIHDAAPAIAVLVAAEWDRGNEYFQPTSFQISNIHAGTGASNIIPGTLDVSFNFRFSPESSAQSLQTRVREILDRFDTQYELEWRLIGEPFLTRRGPLVDALSASVESTAGVRPALSTSGGTSDGRFLATLAREVVEFGPLNESIHKIDEHVRIADLEPLSVIYERTVTSVFDSPYVRR